MTPEELQIWLEARPEDTRAQEAAWIASRAAARVLPVLLRHHGEDDKVDYSGLQSCRCILISGVGGMYPTPEIRFAAANAAAANAAAANAVNSNAATNVVGAARAAANATRTIAKAALAPFAASIVAANAANGSVAGAGLVADTAFLESGGQVADPHPLWPDPDPDEIAEMWQTAQTRLTKDRRADWRSWIDWYNALLEGRPQDLDMLTEIALIPNVDWHKGPAHVNAMIAGIVQAKGKGTPLARAYPVDFSFDSLLRVMRLVGIDDDTSHLRDPGFVQSFRDDCEELRDTLQNFTDYAQAITGGGNLAGVLRLAADKVLKELARIDETGHVRARYLVTLGNELHAFSKEQRPRDDLGETLAGILDNGLKLLRSVTRRHFAPSYTALAPLGQLTLDHIDQEAVVTLLDNMIDRLEALPDDRLVALDPDGLSVLRDMVRETRDIRAAIAEASTDEFRAMLASRLAESLGGTGLAFNRFLEKSSHAAGKVGRSAGHAIETYKKAQSLTDIFNALREFLAGGPPT